MWGAGLAAVDDVATVEGALKGRLKVDKSIEYSRMEDIVAEPYRKDVFRFAQTSG